MQEITHINVNGVTYALAGSNSSGGVTIFTLIPPCTAVPVDSTTMIENIYFNTDLSETEVTSLMDNAFTSVPG